jgi:hypothetical protein
VSPARSAQAALGKAEAVYGVEEALMRGGGFRFSLAVGARLWLPWSLCVLGQALAKEVEVLIVGENNDGVLVAGVENGEAAALPLGIVDPAV